MLTIPVHKLSQSCALTNPCCANLQQASFSQGHHGFLENAPYPAWRINDDGKATASSKQLTRMKKPS